MTCGTAAVGCRAWRGKGQAVAPSRPRGHDAARPRRHLCSSTATQRDDACRARSCCSGCLHVACRAFACASGTQAFKWALCALRPYSGVGA
eukprot:3515748-Prymnesium_polylepis.2